MPTNGAMICPFSQINLKLFLMFMTAQIEACWGLMGKNNHWRSDGGDSAHPTNWILYHPKLGGTYTERSSARSFLMFAGMMPWLTMYCEDELGLSSSPGRRYLFPAFPQNPLWRILSHLSATPTL